MMNLAGKFEQIMSKKPMTLEKLATMIAMGFDTVDKRFESIEKRLSYLEMNVVTKDALQSEIEKLKDFLLSELHGHEEMETASIAQLNLRIKALERRVFRTK